MVVGVDHPCPKCGRPTVSCDFSPCTDCRMKEDPLDTINNDKLQKLVMDKVFEGKKCLGYSRDIKAALKIIEKTSDCFRWAIHTGDAVLDITRGGKYKVEIAIHLGMGDFKEHSAMDHSLPRAICICALKAIRSSESDY